MGVEAIQNPILNPPYEPPAHHFELGPDGPTGEINDGRRPSESFIPIPASQKGKDAQAALDFDATGERRELESYIKSRR
jgi:type III restriction enzyme